VEIPLDEFLLVGDVRNRIIEAHNGQSTDSIESSEVKLIFKGKTLSENSVPLANVVVSEGMPAKSVYKIVAMGISRAESDRADQEYQENCRRNKILVRDDLSISGQRKEIKRKKLGREMMAKVKKPITSSYGFDRLETIPNLPDESKARAILKTLADDPGIKACMTKHKWNVGSLAELYPKGKVGQSEICVMGLNRNKGQQILLRLRTDDLKGFRKILSIREVLYHELAHNVHSEHNTQFFQLMRQIKKECLELDWTRGNGTMIEEPSLQGGTYTLGGSKNDSGLTVRQLAGRAALLRLSADEEEVCQNCGCGHEKGLFLPP